MASTAEASTATSAGTWQYTPGGGPVGGAGSAGADNRTPRSRLMDKFLEAHELVRKRKEDKKSSDVYFISDSINRSSQWCRKFCI